ncbi:YesL family protein [Paractinoplanes durhamensis]|uniref:DUF624 domain-containing protein n=1 Tax=Paractinoplanes durhamensis TaxID=113563 RepID=A0ABQ3ZBX7_9ACTN|nr:DUF624 domain-containing protein [Actinoplanes durhamensis]GIE07321.1 hypothetical protein Adu01nite_86710 [Actinoplanes durhamensis]
MVMRFYEAADELFWAVKLTLLWTVFTLAGGVVLGLGPATLAAYTLARRHTAGETFPAWPAFARAWQREFGRGSAIVLPLAGAAVLLLTNYQWLAAGPARVTTLAALAALAVIAAYLLPMAVHYDLRTPALLPKASLFALLRIPASALLLLTAIAIGYVVSAFPVLLLVAVGGWIQLDTWLCLRLFAENEALRNAKGLT